LTNLTLYYISIGKFFYIIITQRLIMPHPLQNQFIKAIKEGNVAEVDSLLQNDKELLNIKVKFLIGKFDSEINPLHIAAYYGQNEMVKYLVEQGLEINSVDTYSRSALHYAAKNGQIEMVKYLVEQGLKIDSVDNYNKSALHDAVVYGQTEMVKFLYKEIKMDVNAKSAFGTPLGIAIRNNKPQIAEYLRSVGAKEAIPTPPVKQTFGNNVAAILPFKPSAPAVRPLASIVTPQQAIQHIGQTPQQLVQLRMQATHQVVTSSNANLNPAPTPREIEQAREFANLKRKIAEFEQRDQQRLREIEQLKQEKQQQQQIINKQRDEIIKLEGKVEVLQDLIHLETRRGREDSAIQTHSTRPTKKVKVETVDLTDEPKMPDLTPTHNNLQVFAHLATMQREESATQATTLSNPSAESTYTTRTASIGNKRC
jgi:hypothetical protein